MATTTKALFRGAASTSSTTLYTVPSATTTVVTEIMVVNTTSSQGTFTLALDGVSIATAVIVLGNDSTVIPLKQVLATTKTITGLASVTSINFHISGVEIS
jgi:3-dehydroquinate synthase class II